MKSLARLADRLSNRLIGDDAALFLFEHGVLFHRLVVLIYQYICPVAYGAMPQLQQQTKRNQVLNTFLYIFEPQDHGRAFALPLKYILDKLLGALLREVA
jgi:hypothetical protein